MSRRVNLNFEKKSYEYAIFTLADAYQFGGASVKRLDNAVRKLAKQYNKSDDKVFEEILEKFLWQNVRSVEGVYTP